ncbi:MAG TPA: efflux RND transporter periplasmic adaptor subunit [Phycisphaerae bacterium]|nr:efflux RND transporter periplasmic adaptor subunit [Phycisphaerae bacterium]
MMKRMLLMLVVMIVIIAGLGFVKFQQIQTAIAQGASFQPPPEAVTTIVAQQVEWPDTLSAIGSVAAVQGVMVSADLSGTVERVVFDSGRAVRQGEVLVELDTRQEKAQLAAAEAQRDLARTNFDRMQGLLKDNVISRAEYDSATADDKQAEARAGEIRAAIQRKRITAPFSGILGIRQVNVGQYLSSGDPIVQLQSLSPIYVNFDVPQQATSHMRIGREVRISAEGSGANGAPGSNTDDVAGVEFHGRITAIDSVVNSATRNIQVQATLANPEGQLRPGMFVQAQVVLGGGRSVLALPATAISYAPYGDSVYVVANLKGPNGESYRGVRQQFVKVEGSRGDQIGVISGVKPGDEVVTSGVFKLRNAAAVLVNNKVQPGNNPAPKPEDN